VPAWFLAGSGMGLAFPAISVQVLNLSEPAEQGVNSSALQISDGLGSSMAIGVAGALVNLTGLSAAFACGLTIAIVAALAAHRVENRHA
jgi:MFS family permease